MDKISGINSGMVKDLTVSGFKSFDTSEMMFMLVFRDILLSFHGEKLTVIKYEKMEVGSFSHTGHLVDSHYAVFRVIVVVSGEEKHAFYLLGYSGDLESQSVEGWNLISEIPFTTFHPGFNINGKQISFPEN